MKQTCVVRRNKEVANNFNPQVKELNNFMLSIFLCEFKKLPSSGGSWSSEEMVRGNFTVS
jgi:hypothetical protein